MKPKDLAGRSFGRLTCIAQTGSSKQGNATWLCRCQCGKESTVLAGNLLSGHTKSCGCLQRERATQAHSTHALYFDENGKRNKLNRVFATMRQRCKNPNAKCYKDYGGRGITVCKEWDDYKSFYEWAHSNGYREGLSIDRINNDGNYEPENCRWVPMEVQGNNKRNNLMITLNGETKTVTEWAKLLGISRSVIKGRLRRGLAVEDVLGKYCKEAENEAAKA